MKCGVQSKWEESPTRQRPSPGCEMSPISLTNSNGIEDGLRHWWYRHPLPHVQVEPGLVPIHFDRHGNIRWRRLPRPLLGLSLMSASIVSTGAVYSVPSKVDGKRSAQSLPDMRVRAMYTPTSSSSTLRGQVALAYIAQRSFGFVISMGSVGCNRSFSRFTLLEPVDLASGAGLLLARVHVVVGRPSGKNTPSSRRFFWHFALSMSRLSSMALP